MTDAFRSKVEGWVRRLGSTPVEVADPATAWHVQFDYPKNTPHHMHAAMPSGQPGMVVIVSVLNVGHEHLKAFDELDAGSQEEFLYELRHVLNVPEAEFNLEGAGKPIECPKTITITCTRYDDGLTLDSFARSVGAVYKSFLNALWTLQHRLGGQKPGPADRFDFKRLGT